MYKDIVNSQSCIYSHCVFIDKCLYLVTTNSLGNGYCIYPKIIIVKCFDHIFKDFNWLNLHDEGNSTASLKKLAPQRGNTCISPPYTDHYTSPLSEKLRPEASHDFSPSAWHLLIQSHPYPARPTLVQEHIHL